MFWTSIDGPLTAAMVPDAPGNWRGEPPPEEVTDRPPAADEVVVVEAEEEPQAASSAARAPSTPTVNTDDVVRERAGR